MCVGRRMEIIVEFCQMLFSGVVCVPVARRTTVCEVERNDASLVGLMPFLFIYVCQVCAYVSMCVGVFFFSFRVVRYHRAVDRVIRLC